MNNDFKLLNINIRYNNEKNNYEFEANYQNSNLEIITISCDTVSIPNDFIKFSMIDKNKKDLLFPNFYTDAYYSIVLDDIEYLSEKHLSVQDSISFLVNENNKYVKRIRELNKLLQKERLERAKDNQKYKSIICTFNKKINELSLMLKQLSSQILEKL